MGDIAKWAILVAAGLALIGMILAFPIMDYMDVGVYSEGIATIVNYCGSAFIFARGLINNFLSPWARSAISGLTLWFIGKWIVTYSVKMMVWVYRFIFK